MLVKLQRQLSHKGKRSKNYYKTKKKIALCHEKIRNIRKDYLHKVSHEIISENQVIVSENLQIKNMVKNHHLAKAISDVSWYELTRQLEYKAKWNGRKYIKIDTFYICLAIGLALAAGSFINKAVSHMDVLKGLTGNAASYPFSVYNS